MKARTRALQTLGVLVAWAFSAASLAATFIVTTPAEFQAHLTTAASNGQGDDIQVRAGTYTLTATLSYVAAANEGPLTITGDGQTTTIIDGQNNVQILSIDTTAATGASVQVSGLTFRNGNASTVGDTGGGLEIRTGSGAINVASCQFLNNRSVDDGGGLYARITQATETQLRVIDCKFQGNSTLATGTDGGGAHLSAAPFAAVTVRGCEFTANVSQDNGGGLQIEGLDPADPLVRAVGSALLTDNVFTGNMAVQVSSGEGGGADVAANLIDIQANRFYSNSGSSGGGLYLRGFGGSGPVSIALTNSVFMDNAATAGSGGGFATAVIDLTAGSFRVVNNTVFGNSAAVRGGGGYPRAMGSTAPLMSFFNNILWGNTAQQADDLYVDNNPFDDFTGPSVTLTANDMNGLTVKCPAPTCTVTQSGTINIDPRLVDTTGPVYDPHLQTDSPAINAGSNAAPSLPPTDFEGDARILGGTVDIGADESAGAAPPSANLAITMTDSPDPVLTGGRLTYTITVSNAGPDAAAGVSVTDALPANVSFVSATPAQGTCSQTAGTVTCSLGAVANGGSAMIALAVDVTAAAGSTLSNAASVSATTADPNTSNNTTAAVTTQVTQPQADLAVAVTVTPTEPSIDDTVTYTVTVSNRGPDSEPATTLLVTLPAIAEFDSVTAAQGTCKLTSGGLSCTLGTLANGAQTTVTIVMTASEAGTLTLQATVDGQLADGSTANNTAVRQTVVTDVVEIVVKGKGGTGSLGWLELVALSGLLLARRARRVLGASAAAASVAALSLALAALPGPAQAQPPDTGWYVGASAGQSSAGYDAADLTSDLANRGWTILDPAADDTDTFWKAYVGYQATSYLAVEAGYADLGEVRTSYRAVLPPSQIDALLQDTFAVHPYLGDGWTASVVLSQGFAEDAFAVFARAGLFHWKADIKVEVVSGGTGQVTGDESGTDVMFGVGAEWRINPTWSLRIEWERYKLNDWVDVPSAGLTLRFR